MSKASTQKQLPLSKNGHLGLRRQRRRCGFCGFNVTINADRTMRVHGPTKQRCIGSGLQWTPVFHTTGGITMLWGTCGVCGTADEFWPGTHTYTDAALKKRWLGKHNHEKPHVHKDRETGLWVVLVVNHRTGKRLTIERETVKEAHAKAIELIELRK